MYDDPENESKSKKVNNGVHLKIIILKKFVCLSVCPSVRLSVCLSDFNRNRHVALFRENFCTSR